MKLYIPISERSGAMNYAGAFKRLGIEVVSFDKDDADGVMVFCDHATYKVAGHARYMPLESLEILLNRDRNHETGLATLPTTRIERAEDAPEGAMVKPRNSGTMDGYVWQPHLGFPIEDVDVTIAVNKDSKIMTFDEHHMEHHGYKKPGNTRPIDPAVLAELKPKIEQACKKLQITGGIHNVQFLKHEGQWCLTDWNPRPGISHTHGLVALSEFSDRPLAFMLGMALPEHVPHAIATREYWSAPIPSKMEPAIRELGLFPRRVCGIDGFTRITGVAKTREALDAAFQTMESMCADRAD